MGPYNSRNGFSWPKSKQNVIVHNSERTQYDLATVITVDSPLRGKWITDFVDEKYSNKMIMRGRVITSQPCQRFRSRQQPTALCYDPDQPASLNNAYVSWRGKPIIFE